MATGARLPERHGWLRSAVAEYIEEEIGHEEWILNDIAACGFDAEAVRSSQPAVATELMVSYAYDTVQRVNPVGFFGMVHVLEGTSIGLADQAASTIRERLSLPKKAFSYLYSHGALDLEHVKFFEDLMNRIEDPADQAQIVHCRQRVLPACTAISSAPWTAPRRRRWPPDEADHGLPGARQVLLTGATGGIGQAIAVELDRAGAAADLWSAVTRRSWPALRQRLCATTPGHRRRPQRCRPARRGGPPLAQEPAWTFSSTPLA